MHTPPAPQCNQDTNEKLLISGISSTKYSCKMEKQLNFDVSVRNMGEMSKYLDPVPCCTSLWHRDLHYAPFLLSTYPCLSSQVTRGQHEGVPANKQGGQTSQGCHWREL